MKIWIGWLLGTLVLSAVIHLMAIVGLPYIVIGILKLKTDAEPNKIVYAPPVTADFRYVVRPSPDLLYSGCSYDVSEKPIRIIAPVPDTYFSISAYAANTDNFFVINDRQVESKQVEIVMVGEGMNFTQKGNEKVVVAPTNTGIVLFRLHIKDINELADLIKIQKQATCSPVN